MNRMAWPQNITDGEETGRPRSHSVKVFVSLLQRVGRLFDTIAIEHLDRLPNAVTVAIFVALLATAHVSMIAALWLLFSAKYLWATAAAVGVTSILAGIPIVSFGQMQYRRARSAYLASEALTRQLIVANGEALRASREKSQFLASMSHELRTPLNAIIGFSEILKEQTFGPLGLSKYVEYARDIYKSGVHLLDLINDVLDLSRIESGNARVRLVDAEVDVASEIYDACQLLKVLATKSGVALLAEEETGPRPAQPIRVWADRRMIRQILLNLVSNAVKFTPEAGKVVVRTRLDPEKGAIVEVCDTGVGMTDEEVATALQPFGQIDSCLSRKHKGTGLGLPLAKAMIELHGGTLEIRSVPGTGTTFAFNIPNARLVAPTDQHVLMARRRA